jgi:hypothetical protein
LRNSGGRSEGGRSQESESDHSFHQNLHLIWDL